ncbi:dihydroceramide delta(4)-desaturase [Rhizoctonia solani AG-1 IA]|uniref:sphingolipid 4-desaturase n=1 Tax=Thanatephorus cucumeris (strain AG1-IA) TaxID=983506 RepID=L8X5F0_THACA|nr:dihydroceramide delta(4)-desaturase [Rhizoctonia solani AG-1 IA]
MISPTPGSSSAPLIGEQGLQISSTRANSLNNADFSLFGGAESLSEGRPSPKHPRRTVTVSPTAADVQIPKAPQDPSDFLWLMTEEPHRSRRQAILKAHPEVYSLRFFPILSYSLCAGQVTKLMGYEPLTKYVVSGVVGLQIATAYYLIRVLRASPLSVPFLLASYAIGGTANHNLFLAIHEITHNLAFKGVKANKLFAMFANLPIGIPYAITFKVGPLLSCSLITSEDGIDTDLPSRLEMLCLQNVAGKAFFWSVPALSPFAHSPNSHFTCSHSTFQILFYALRPGFIRSQKPTPYHFLSIVTQLAFDLVLYLWLGPHALIYLIMSSFFAGSLHPCAAHFIAEHYLWDGLDQETYSYYGPLNILAYNVGYHNEHHDFPSVPWTRLPALRKLAPEFYDTIPSHPSWPMLTYRFIFDPDVGLYSRVKRAPKESQARLAREGKNATAGQGKEEERGVGVDRGYASDEEECGKNKKA